MTSCEFNIPITRDDLLKKSGAKQYVVENLIIVRHLSSKLKDVESRFRVEKTELIFTSFDFFFSVLISFNQATPEVKESSWKLLLKILNAEINILVPLLEGQLSPDEKLKHINCIKMVCYLLCQFGHNFETAQDVIATLNTGKGKKKTAKKDEDSELIEWPMEKEAVTKMFLQLMQLNINKLWDPPIVEEDFVNLIGNFAYKLLENNASCKNKTLKDSIYNIIGLMVKRHSHLLGCTLKILQLLQHHEHLVAPLAQMVELIAVQLEVRSIVSEILRELAKLDGEELAKDTSGTRAFSMFLAELGRLIPALILPNLCLVLPFLDMKEPYTMRNSVLSVMGDIIVKNLNGENLDAKQKHSRDQLLDRLEDHLIDVNAFVRSKVLQIWLLIVNEKALPLPRRQGLLVAAKGRVEDKSYQVRKNALQLIIALIKLNPLAVQLTPEELAPRYEKEMRKLEEMLNSNADQPEIDDKESKVLMWGKLNKALGGIHNQSFNPFDESDSGMEGLSSEEKGESSGEGSNSEAEIGDRKKDRNKNLIGKFETIDGVKRRLVELMDSFRLKEAIKLFKQMLITWPNRLQSIKKLNLNDDDDDDESEGDVDDTNEIVSGLKKIYLDRTEAVSIKLPLDTEEEEEENILVDQPMTELCKQKVLVKFLKESLEFIMEVYATIPLACEMLRFKSSSDILESIDFFINGFESGVSMFLMGIKKMLFLIYSKEVEVREAVIGAYRRIYFNPNQSNIRQQSITIATSLLSLITSCENIGDSDSLEKLISEFVKTEDITPGIIQILWEKFSMKMPGTNFEESKSALNLLAMIASVETKLVSSNLDVVVAEGLGTRAEESNLFACDVCKILMKLCVIPSGLEAAFRLPSNHEIFTRLQHLLLKSYFDTDKNDWIPFADTAIPLIFKLSEHPEKICENLIIQMAQFNSKNLDSTLVDADVVNLLNAESTSSIHPTLLSRFLFVVGHVALNEFEHLDVSVFAELKQRNKLQELRRNKSKKKKESLVAASATTSLSRSKNKIDSNSTTIEEEMGLGGAEVDDAEADLIRKITENEIVSNNESLLGCIAPFVVHVVRDQTKYKQTDVQASAVLALTKFMITSSIFCEEHLPLLFTLLEKSQNQTVRCNVIISLGDLIYRMPNLIEPWTANIYARLRDDNLQVRRTTIILLTGLILHDMIKVKGQVSELGICLLDDDPDVAMIAKHFFAEFSKKMNSIYNILPDVISRLSDESTGVDEDKFRIILKALISYIQKEKQFESLVEKLCQRFRTTVLARGWRDIAYCISLLPSNEKSVKKLQELFGCFADKLSDDFVYECFTTVIANAKKSVKENTQVLIEEFEQKLEEARCKGVENEEVAKKANNAKTKASKSTRGRKARDEGNAMEEDEEVTRQPKPTRSSKDTTAQQRSKPKLVFSSDEDDFMDEDEAKRCNKKTNKLRNVVTTTGKKKLNRISSESDNFSITDSDSDDVVKRKAVLSKKLENKRR